ncbi:FIST signal transduction protein [Kineosporia sp. A_224]|uniref:FIST signal transduction protein n=1 Tax=Kineosporia sp. A_224 TaxID=1962180 RepID=UPI000B4AF340|nr:FIST N-terminal domain-containing protein [Kineosporia sp. A_224]
MSIATHRDLAAASARATGPAPDAVRALVAQLHDGLGGRTAGAVLWFASSAYDPADLAGPLADAFPGASVLGCSTAGEFSDDGSGTGGLTAVALPEGMVVRSAVALGELADDVAAGTDAAVAAVEAGLGEPLRGLDPARHLALVLIDGLHASEELVNERIGNAAPLLDVVGGSAGDDLRFESTWVAVGRTVSRHGVALLVLEAGVPFRVVKSCAFSSAGHRLTVTRTDASARTVLEFDHLSAVEAYAAAVGIETECVDATAFMRHPLGLMIDGEPWLRSPRAVVDHGGIAFYAAVPVGTVVEVVDAGDLVAATREAVHDAVAAVGGRAGGAVMFNCILRRLQMDAEHSAPAFVEAFGGIPVAGFHTYGETWLGHVNQTLTGVVFG